MKSQFQIQAKRMASTTAAASKAARYVPKSGIYPRGFRVSGVHVGVKPGSSTAKPDLALVVSDVQPCNGAAVFTRNLFKAAPVQVSKQVLDKSGGSNINGIITNSGCANAVTGADGLRDALSMAKALDSVTGSSDNDNVHSLVMSTGVIGQKLPIEKILSGVKPAFDALGSDHDHWLNTANAFCTTDTFPKLVFTEVDEPSEGISFRIAGIAKGAGMIHPNMGTLLGFLATDASISGPNLSQLIKTIADKSFNCISVDGDTSTNDTIAILANGANNQPTLEPGTERYAIFEKAATSIAQQLAQLVVRDGEGATKFVEILVDDAPSYEAAKQVAQSVATSSLVKTALYGKDANWGRILCATGYAGVDLDPTKVDVSFISTTPTKEQLKLLVQGEPQNVDEVKALELLSQEDLKIHISLGSGKGSSAKYWTSDLSHEYISINADYRS